MRYQEFNLTEDELFELKMSPGNLTKMAKNIDARVGMEFELIVPGVESDEEEYESEPDYDADESFPTGPGWTRDVISFFRGGDMGNSTGTIQRAIDSLNEDFYAWIDEDQEEYINSDEGRNRAIEIARDNVDPEEYEQDPEGVIQQYLEYNDERIRDELVDEYNDDLDSKFERWLDDQGINSMADFANEYNLDWPYWTQPEYYGGGGSVSIDAVADEFSQAIDRPVNASSSYHGATRRPGHYVVEPDGSLQGDRGETGLEFVSPVLTVPEMLEDIDKVAKWASQAGAYTNSSTGLHMNVSVPDQQNLDYVKLAMFLGDNYILKQFGREGNSYCKSALNKIKQQAKQNPDRVDEMLRQFQGGLNQLASKMIHTGSTEKFVSINNRENWIEFRSPGGDWLGDDLGPVKNTLLRAVVALDVATKPQEYKQEYYKKLYKTLSQGTEDSSIEYFAKYAAGELPKAALKSFIRQIQTKRQVSKEKPDSGKRYWWRVSRSGYPSSIEVVAATREEAIDKGTSSPDGYASWRGQPDLKAEPIRPYEETPQQTPSRDQEFTGTWEVVSRSTDEVVHTISGIGNAVADAERHAARWQEQTGFDDPVYVRPQMRPIQARSGEPVPAGAVSGSTQDLQRQRLAAQMPALDTADGNWEIYNISSQNTVYRFAANTEEQAVQAFRIWQDAIREPSLSREGFNLRTTPRAAPQMQQPPARGSDNLPPGNVRWRILDFDDNEVHSFVHRTVQREANAYAIQWLRQNNMLGRGEFRVVPVQ
jgi:hypothetical protein